MIFAKCGGEIVGSFTTSVASYCVIYQETPAYSTRYGDVCRAILAYVDRCAAYFA